MDGLIVVAAVLTIILSFIKVFFFDDRHDEDQRDRRDRDLDNDHYYW